MFRQIFWINLGLLVIVFLLGLNVNRVWSPIIKEEWKNSLYVSAKTMPKGELIFEEEQEVKPALYTYDVIADKNVFRPQRTKWLPPLPKENEKKISKKPRQRNQRAMKGPVLYGIMIIKGQKKAILKGWIRGEPKKRFRKIRVRKGEYREVPLPSRPGKIEADKIRTYQIGDEICESIVVDILPDRIILSKNGEESEILLREPSRLAAKNAPVPDQKSDRPKIPQRNQRGQKPTSSASGKAQKNLRPPAYPLPPGYPGYQFPQAQRRQPGVGYPAFPPPRGGVSNVKGRPPFQQPGYVLPPGYQGKDPQGRSRKTLF